MTFQYREAKRENVPLLLGIAGGTGAGKTWSAMALAKGMAGGKRFAVVDTENGRARHYADDFDFDTADLAAPFRPERYADAIQAADKAGYGVIVVDSMSHEWAGDGGILDWQEEEFKRLGSREAVRMTSWIVPKMAHRKMVTRLLQVSAHVILCFRAAERVDMVRDATGKMQVVPKASLTGLDGWIPIAERTLPFELTASVLMTADRPGYPKAIKLPRQFAEHFSPDRPITEETGKALASWAAGGAAKEQAEPKADDSLSGEIFALTNALVAFGDAAGNRDAVVAAVGKNRADNPDGRHVDWLKRQIVKAEAAAAVVPVVQDDDASLFQIPESARA